VFTSWWFFGLIVLVVVVGGWRVLRNYGRWSTYDTREDVEKMRAEDRFLESKRNSHGGR
jgi:hypothetical protein